MLGLALTLNCPLLSFLTYLPLQLFGNPHRPLLACFVSLVNNELLVSVLVVVEGPALDQILLMGLQIVAK